MASLGSFGKQHLPTDHTFDYFGHDIRVHPDVTNTVFIDFMEAGAKVSGDGVTEAEVVERTLATKQLVRDYIHPDDFDLFWDLGNRHRQSFEDRMETVGDVSRAMTEAATGRPTLPSAASSAGQRQTGESEVDFLKRVMPNRPEIRAGMYDELARKRAATG